MAKVEVAKVTSHICAAHVRIRPATSADPLSATALLRALYPSDQPGALLADLRARLSPFCLVVEDGATLAGLLVAARLATSADDAELAPLAFPHETEYLEIQDLYVLPAFRHRGIASALMREVLGRAQVAGLHRAMVYSANDDRPAIARFYQQFGFRLFRDNWQSPDTGRPHVFLIR